LLGISLLGSLMTEAAQLNPVDDKVSAYARVTNRCTQNLRLVGASLDGKDWDNAGAEKVLPVGTILRLTIAKNGRDRTLVLNFKEDRHVLAAGAYGHLYGGAGDAPSTTSVKLITDARELFFDIIAARAGGIIVVPTDPMSDAEKATASELNIFE